MSAYTKEQCIEFLKEYKQFKKKTITRVKNPTTGRYLTSSATIDGIKEKCKEQHQVESKSSSSSSPTVNFNNIIPLFKLPFDKNIINAYVPNSTDAIKIITKYIKTNPTDPNVIQYNNILKYIREIIPDYNPLEWDKDSTDIFAMFNLTYTESYHLDREQQRCSTTISKVLLIANLLNILKITYLTVMTSTDRNIALKDYS